LCRYVTSAGASADGDALGLHLHRETNGNPFFLGELVRLLASERRLASGQDLHSLPPGVREVVSRRLDRLGAGCRTVLAVGALLGDCFDVGRLEMVCESSSADGGTVADVLDRALRDRILVANESGYAFAHALIRRVVLDEIEPSRRAAWHERIAETLERAAGARADAVAAELVRHFASAGTRAALAKAFTHACRGAEHRRGSSAGRRRPGSTRSRSPSVPARARSTRSARWSSGWRWRTRSVDRATSPPLGSSAEKRPPPVEPWVAPICSGDRR
jgi:hypothetical protein